MNAGLDYGMVGGEKGVQPRAQAAFPQEEAALEQARAFLKSGREIDAGIAVCLAQLDQARAWDERLRDEKDQTIAALRAQIITRLDALKDTRLRIRDVILRVGDSEVRTVLLMRCLTYKTWPQIGIALGLDDSAAKRRYARGEKLVAFVLSDRDGEGVR